MKNIMLNDSNITRSRAKEELCERLFDCAPISKSKDVIYVQTQSDDHFICEYNRDKT